MGRHTSKHLARRRKMQKRIRTIKKAEKRAKKARAKK